MKNQEEINKTLAWAQELKLSAHDVFDDMNDRLESIKAFYSDECPKDESGIVLSLHDAELLAYEFARRLLNEQKESKRTV